MKRIITRLYAIYLTFAGLLNAFLLPVRASSPATGDTSPQLMGWIMIALGASMVVVIFIIVANMRGRRK